MIGKAHITKNYERWRIREPTEFVQTSFKTDDIGRKGFSKRIAGRLKKNGQWATQSMLISHAETPDMKKKLRQTVRDMIRRA